MNDFKIAHVPSQEYVDYNTLNSKSVDYFILAYSQDRCIGYIQKNSIWECFTSSNSQNSIGAEDTLSALVSVLSAKYPDVSIRYIPKYTQATR